MLKTIIYPKKWWNATHPLSDFDEIWHSFDQKELNFWKSDNHSQSYKHLKFAQQHDEVLMINFAVL